MSFESQNRTLSNATVTRSLELGRQAVDLVNNLGSIYPQIKKILLVGSAVTGLADNSSDIDLVVVTEADLPGVAELAFRDQIEPRIRSQGFVLKNETGGQRVDLTFISEKALTDPYNPRWALSDENIAFLVNVRLEQITLYNRDQQTTT